MKIRACSFPSARWAILACSLSFLSACGGGGGGGSSDSGSTNSSTPVNTSTSSSQGSSASSSKANSSAQSSSTNSSTRSSSSSAASTAVYVTSPVVSSCTPGVVTDSVKTAVLAKLNALRARHGLPAVTYDSSDDAAASAAALYMVANNALTHTPSSSGTCYTAEAKRLAGTSNLYMGWSSGSTLSMDSTDAIMGYANDSSVESLGHRRWVLYPFFAKTTFGRADGDSASGVQGRMASSLRTIGGEASSVSMNNDFVAFPYGSYSVSEFTPSWYLSFSVVASKTNINANSSSNVNLDSATITVKDGSGNSLAVSSKSTNYEYYGLPNNLQWKVDGLTAGGNYTVTIANVTVNGAARTFTYSFQLTN